MADTVKILIVCCGLLLVAPVEASPGGEPVGPPLPREVATGAFDCSVMIVDPPVGNGIPSGRLVLGFTATTGITDREIVSGVPLGTGDGLEEKCETLSGEFRSAALALGCVAGPIRLREITGGNFTDKNWFFDIVCSDGRDRVMNAIGALAERTITTPLAAELIRSSDPGASISAGEHHGLTAGSRHRRRDAHAVKEKTSGP